MIQKKIIYIDLDDTVADFFGAAKDLFGGVDEGKMYEHDFFFNLKPIDGALSNVRRLILLGFDVWILSQPLFNSAASYEQKARWVSMWFPELSNKLVLTQNKGLHLGDYLIDDNGEKWKVPFEKNGGKFVQFGSDRSKMTKEEHRREWERIYNYFLGEDSHGS